MDQNESCVPPGFRFHPTEEELVGYYLIRKVNSLKFDLDVIIDIDLYRMEPWQIQDKCKLGYNEQNEWYFFSHKDRKYPSGTRTNRATASGFWKATGRDKAVLSKNKMIGMRKTLVYYRGRAPNGRKTDWIMHEYRIQTTDHAPPQEEGWVVCRAFKKPSPSHNFYYMKNCINNHNDRLIASPSSMANIASPSDLSDSLTNNQGPTNFHDHQQSVHQQHYNSNNNNISNFDQDLITFNGSDFIENNNLIMELPRLDSPSLSTSFATKENLHDQVEIMSNNNKWDFLDDLQGNSSQFVPQNASFSNHQSMQELSSHDYEQEVNNHQFGSYMGCYPDL